MRSPRPELKFIVISLVLVLAIPMQAIFNQSRGQPTDNQNLLDSAVGDTPLIEGLEEQAEKELLLPVLRPTDAPGENDADSGGDAGDLIAFPTPIVQGNYSGYINQDLNEKDFYSFTVDEGVIINVTMLSLNQTMNFNLVLYSTEAEILAANPRDAGIRETIYWSTSTAGIYSIVVEPDSESNTGNYTFELSLTAQDDFNSNSDAWDSITEPLPITEGASNGTLVVGSDEDDFYQLTLIEGQVVEITLTPSSTTNIDISLFNVNDILLYKSEQLTGLNESIYWSINTEGNYSLWVNLVEETSPKQVVQYNLTISSFVQNDAKSGSDAGNTPEDASDIYPLTNSTFNGQLVWNGDRIDFYRFSCRYLTVIYTFLIIPADVNFDLVIYDEELVEIYNSRNALPGANEAIQGETLDIGTYYLSVEFMTNGVREGDYVLKIGLIAVENTVTGSTVDLEKLIPTIISSVLVPLFFIVILILVLYLFTDVRIPWVSNRLDKYFSKGGKGETVKSLKYALKVRDRNIAELREELIDKDSKRAKDLETIHFLEEDQKSKEKVLSKLREEKNNFKTRLDNLEEVNNDLANIIDSTIRRQIGKSSKKEIQKTQVSAITGLLWLSEERLKKYVESIPLLNERYILDKSKNFILTKDYAREIVRQAYWKRVGAMHLNRIKQVKVTSLAQDTNIDIKTIKIILRELVERKEIPTPIHMDRESLLLSISEELISELADLAQNTAVLSLKQISKSYDTSEESAKVIFERIAEEGYVKGEFINEDKFVVMDLFAKEIISEGSINITTFAAKHNLAGEEEEVRILIERLLKAKEIEGIYLTKNHFLSFTNLNKQLKELLIESIEDIKKGDTRHVVFDLGSVVESILKQKLLLEIHEMEDIDKLPKYQEIIESRELGKILRAAEDTKITLPATVELKSLNRYWAQRIKHTKPGELPYVPSVEESRRFLFETNKALNKLLSLKIPAKWKKIIAQRLLRDMRKK